jgi:hypothetical protein
LAAPEPSKAPVSIEIQSTVAKEPTVEPEPIVAPQETITTTRILGTKEQWMAEAGIPEYEWQYVDYVIAGKPDENVSGEGGWNGVQRWNTAGSGAYGLCQSLPASKMAAAGADWRTNPVTQLRWCSGHAAAYGGWQAAWNFRKCVGNCYSAAAKRVVYKDHTWW